MRDHSIQSGGGVAKKESIIGQEENKDNVNREQEEEESE